MEAKRTASGIIIPVEESRGKLRTREKDPVSALLTKLSLWLAQQPEHAAIMEMPRTVRRNMERDILRRVFTETKSKP